MDLFQRFALGEIDAFETLVRQSQGDLYAWIVRIVRDPGIAEDLTVETLWRAYRARKQFRPDGNFAAWSRRIATNLALDHLRRKRPEQSHSTLAMVGSGSVRAGIFGCALLCVGFRMDRTRLARTICSASATGRCRLLPLRA